MRRYYLVLHLLIFCMLLTHILTSFLHRRKPGLQSDDDDVLVVCSQWVLW